MSAAPRRGVTRAYVGGLVFAVAVVALALLVAGWGGIALMTTRDPVTAAGAPRWAAPGIVGLALVLLGWGLWTQALGLLRGRSAPSWGHALGLGGGAYLLWCLGGMLAGFRIEDTWTSPFSAWLAAMWAIASLVFWAVLARRVYTDRPTPRWPWDRPGEPGPDWEAGPGAPPRDER